MTEQELKKLRDIIYAVYEGGRMRVARIDICHIACKSILALIKEAGYVKLADDQSLPFRAPNCECVDCWSSFRYLHEKQDGEKMLKEGWRKVEIWKSP